MKLFFVFGTRPELIKLFPVIKEFKNSDFEIKICLTGQHKEMAEPFLELFQIKPDYNLNLMKENQSLEHITKTVLIQLSEILEKEKPDYLIVQGDTTTAMASSLAAYYKKIKIAHIEAGLRTYNKLQPFPEEINRRIIDVVSDLFFAPTKESKQNLLNEGIKKEKIIVTGNTIIDALLWIIEQPFLKKTFFDELPKNKRIVLVTCHRRESFGKPLEKIFNAIKEISEFENSFIVFPVHLNPNVRKKVNSILSNKKNVLLTKPLDYKTFVHLMKKSFILLTDSGGLQEEAPFLNKPVLVLRKKTERSEAVITGAAKLVGVETQKIVKETKKLFENKELYNKMASAENPFGNGTASKKIFDCFKEIKNE